MIFNTKPKVPSLAEMLADQRRKRISAYRDKVRYTKTYEMECEIEEYLAAEADKEAVQLAEIRDKAMQAALNS